MRVAIRAVGEHNIKMLDMIRQCDEIEVVCYADIDGNKWTEDGAGEIPVISVVEAYSKYKEGKIDKFFISPYLSVKYVDRAYKEMIDAGLADEDICIPSVSRINESSKLILDEISNGDFKKSCWHQMHYLEFHIMDSCNLNCKGCIHFSSLNSPDTFVSLSCVQNDLARLKNIVEHIEVIRIMGGEPLLNPEWKKYISLTQKYYPYTEIHLATNGLLLNNLNEEDLKYLKNNNICVDITTYQPIWNSIETIVEKLKKEKIKFKTSAPVTSFRSCIRIKGGIDAEINRKNCGAWCFNMHDGFMAPCPIMMYIKTFNDYFHTTLPETKPVDLNEAMEFDEFIDKMNQPMELCAYCDQSKEFKWERISNTKETNSGWCTE